MKAKPAASSEVGIQQTELPVPLHHPHARKSFTYLISVVGTQMLKHMSSPRMKAANVIRREVEYKGLVSELKFLVPWGHIAAKAWGSPQGRPVLCLHGWMDNADSFSKLIPLLPKDCYYMAIDFAGHGLSSHRPAGCPYYLIDYVSDVRRVAA
ncbi:hypothetical protein JD844_028240, partial [Phrynosoma platyrhinos]